MAAQLDIPLRRNEVWSRGWRISDGDGQPLDITGWTIAMHVRSRVNNSALIAAAEIEITDGPNGEFSTVLRAGEDSALYALGSPLQTLNLPYDLRATDEAGTSLVLAAGVVVLSRGVTHD